MAKEKVSKADAMRNAFATMGVDAELDAVKEWVKTQYGIDLEKAHISQFKSNAKRKAKLDNIPKKVVKASESGKIEIVPLANSPVHDVTDIVAFVKMVQKAKEELGAETVKQIVDSTLN